MKEEEKRYILLVGEKRYHSIKMERLGAELFALENKMHMSYRRSVELQNIGECQADLIMDVEENERR